MKASEVRKHPSKERHEDSTSRRLWRKAAYTGPPSLCRGQALHALLTPVSASDEPQTESFLQRRDVSAGSCLPEDTLGQQPPRPPPSTAVLPFTRLPSMSTGTRFHHVGQADLELLTSGDPPPRTPRALGLEREPLHLAVSCPVLWSHGGAACPGGCRISGREGLRSGRRFLACWQGDGALEESGTGTRLGSTGPGVEFGTCSATSRVPGGTLLSPAPLPATACHQSSLSGVCSAPMRWPGLKILLSLSVFNRKAKGRSVLLPLQPSCCSANSASSLVVCKDSTFIPVIASLIPAMAKGPQTQGCSLLCVECELHEDVQHVLESQWRLIPILALLDFDPCLENDNKIQLYPQGYCEDLELMHVKRRETMKVSRAAINEESLSTHQGRRGREWFPHAGETSTLSPACGGALKGSRGLGGCGFMPETGQHVSHGSERTREGSSARATAVLSAGVERAAVLPLRAMKSGAQTCGVNE
ncbi:hypothetical protein AAY473_011237 [Plecturocebus cupreus]